MENKKKIIASIFIVAAVAALVAWRQGGESQAGLAAEKKAVAVEVEKVANLNETYSRIKYPAIVAGDQEAEILAGTGGTATAVNFRLGDRVAKGKLLVRIDDQAGALGQGGQGFVSGQIQQLENAFEQADETYDQAKWDYEKDDTEANKTAKNIAKLRKENARIALDAAIDSRSIKAPITGTVVSKNISAGDSVAAGQVLAVLSEPSKIKIRFYVGQDGLADLKLGGAVAVDNGEKEVQAKITNISIQAEEATGRFLIEAAPSGSDVLRIGTVVDVLVDARRGSGSDDAIVLPLDALTVGQNGTYLFVAENGQAKGYPAEIVKIFGENARVRAELAPENLVVVQGSKLLQEGDKLEIK